MREREKRFLDRLPLEKRLNTMTFIIIIPLTVLVIYLMATVVKFCNAYNQSIVNITDVNNSMAYFREDLDYTMYRIAIGTMTYQDIHDMPEEDRPYGWEQIKDPHEMINSTRKVYRQLLKRTTDDGNRRRITWIIHCLDQLEDRVDEIEDNLPYGSYDKNMLLLEKGVQYVTEDGQPNIDTPEHAEAITFIRKMIDAGICEVAPGGKFHCEEWYGHLNNAGVASIAMPLWYMGRFTDYCPDLNGKIAIYKIPVWNKGDTRCVLQGGTGTSVTNQSANQDLAKEFLAYAKLSEEGNRYIWEKLGFDPIRTSLWDDEALTHDQNNKFIQYFNTNPFDVLNEIRDEYGIDLTAPNISGAYANVRSILGTTTYTNAFELSLDEDVNQLLENEQASVIYDE